MTFIHFGCSKFFLTNRRSIVNKLVRHLLGGEVLLEDSRELVLRAFGWDPPADAFTTGKFKQVLAK